DAARAHQQSGALPTLIGRSVEYSRSSPPGRRRRLPGDLETETLPPRPPPVGHCARHGTRTVRVEDRLRRSAPIPASLLSSRPDPARLRCPTAGVCHWPSGCTLV